MISFNTLLPTIQSLGMLGYWLVFLIALGESLIFVSVFFPGTILVITAGFLSAHGYLDFGDLVWFAAIGVLLGDVINYWLGARGIKFFHQESKFLKLSHLKRGETFFKKHGRKSVFLSKFVGPFRTIIPFIAGLSKMDKKIFLFWDVVGAFSWSIIHLAIGYFFGGASRVIEIWSTGIGLFVLALFLLLVAIWFIIEKSKPTFSLFKSISYSIKNAVANNPDVKQFSRDHPKLIGFIKKRFDKRSFSGLPLTFLLAAFLYFLFLFAGTIEDIISSHAIIVSDTQVANLFLAFRDTEFVKIFTWITVFGKWQIILSAAVIFSLILWLWKKRSYIVPLWTTILGTGFFVYLGKILFHRPRPNVAIYLEHDFSFPSGHAAMSIAFYGFIAYVLFQQIKQWKYKVAVLFSSIALIIIVGLSRLYLGVHYFSDVWGGYLLGILWLIIGIAISEWLQYHKPFSLFNATRKVKLAATGLILLEIVFYITFAIHYSPPLAHRNKSRSTIIVTDVLDAFRHNPDLRFTETLIGQRQEPISFIIVAKNNDEFIKTIEKAGWYLADPATFASVAKLIQSVVLKQSYPTAPMTPSFWNTKVHNFGFEKPTSIDNPRQRHHARFWRTCFITQDNQYVYVGTASLDIGVKWGITHKIKPDIDTERELFFSDLKKTGMISSFQKVRFVKPILGRNFSGDNFFTDGKAYIVKFK